MIVVLIFFIPPPPSFSPNHLHRKWETKNSNLRKQERNKEDKVIGTRRTGGLSVCVCAGGSGSWLMEQQQQQHSTALPSTIVAFRRSSYMLSRAVKRDPQEGGRQAHVRSFQCATLTTYFYT